MSMKKVLVFLSLSCLSALCFSQTKPAYGVSEITFINKDGYMNDYAPKVRQVFAKCGSTFIVSGGRSKPILGLDNMADRVTINKFESYEKAEACYNSKEYLDLRPLANKYAKIRLYLIEGIEPK